jgi:hypothetical protein
VVSQVLQLCLWFHIGFTLALCGVTVVLQWCYSVVTVLQDCETQPLPGKVLQRYSGVTVSVTVVLQVTLLV